MRLDPHTGIAEFKEALRLQPGNADAHYNLPGLLAAQGDLDSTIAEYRLALVLKLNDRDSHNNLGLVLQQKGRGGASHQSVQGSLASPSHISGIALQPGQRPGPAEGLGVGRRRVPIGARTRSNFCGGPQQSGTCVIRPRRVCLSSDRISQRRGALAPERRRPSQLGSRPREVGRPLFRASRDIPRLSARSEPARPRSGLRAAPQLSETLRLRPHANPSALH